MDSEESSEGRLAYGGFEQMDLEAQNNPSPWQKFSSKYLLLIAIVITMLVSILLLVLIFLSLGFPEICKSQIDLSNVCLTPECIHESTMTLQYMDANVSPCDDFYQFSCGNYINANKIPDNEMLISVLNDIDDKYREQLRVIIEKNYFPSNLPPFSVLATFYNNCMNKVGIEKIGLRTISKILKDLGGWPVVEGGLWQVEQFQWVDTIGKFTDMGFSTDYFFQFYYGFNFTNIKDKLYTIDQPYLGPASQFFIKGFNDPFVKAYYKFMVDVAVIFGASKARANKEMKEVMEFQIELAKGFKSLEDQRNMSRFNNPMTVGEIEEKYGNIPWNEYSRKVLRKKSSFEKDEFIMVYHPSYFVKLNNMIQETSSRTLANFIFWRSIDSVVEYLPDAIREAELDFKTVRQGITERTPRWKECIDNSVKLIEPVIAYIYHQTFFNETTLDKTVATSAKKLVNEVHQEFLNMLEKIDWMDVETKKKALDKANAISMRIADENYIASFEELHKKYISYNLKSDGDYLKSYLTIHQNDKNSDTNENEENHEIDLEWHNVEGPALLNPTYNWVMNQINIPAGILQNPFMNEKRPQYINYGTLGFVVGHEITHGFDDLGHNFDKGGNLNDWWDKKTKEQYIKQTKCLVYQYGNYSSEEVGERLNGIVSLGENMADNGGVKVAHTAYQKWVKENGPEKRLPGLDYTPLQLFWIKLAQTWCIKFRPQILRELIVTNQHSPEEFRIKGSVSNSPEFAKDFQCPSGSHMNPTKKCIVW